MKYPDQRGCFRLGNINFGSHDEVLAITTGGNYFFNFSSARMHRWAPERPTSSIVMRERKI